MPVQNYRGADNLSGDWGLKSLGGDNILDRDTIVQTIRTRFTTAQVNAGATLLSAKAGYKYRMVDVIGIAVGGAAATVTTVDVLGTQSTSSVKLAAFAQASMTRSTVLRPGVSGCAVLADGASFAACDANTAVTVGITGDDLATATHVDILFSYVLEAA